MIVLCGLPFVLSEFSMTRGVLVVLGVQDDALAGAESNRPDYNPMDLMSVKEGFNSPLKGQNYVG